MKKNNKNNINNNSKLLKNNNNPFKKDISNKNKQNKAELNKDSKIPSIFHIVPKPNIYKFYINNSKLNEIDLFFKSNKISTTKYNWFTFLPKALLFQFMRLANVYFLLTTILQCIPIISPLSPVSSIAPFIIVLSVSLIREGIEDHQRSKVDKEQNNEKVEVFRDGMWMNTVSGDLKMGEICSVKNNGTFPADLVCIDSSLIEGICYIETGTLDGEKTLKVKCSPDLTKDRFKSKRRFLNDYKKTTKKKTTNKKSNENEKILDIISSKNITNDILSSNDIDERIPEKLDYFYIGGIGTCDLPNPALYSLNGKFNLLINGESIEFPLEAKNLLLKGAKLRNTDWIIGIVIYTGHNCKIMKNSKEGIIKFSTVEKLMNRLLIIILIVQIILSIISAIFHKIYFTNHEDLIYADDHFEKDEPAYNLYCLKEICKYDKKTFSKYVPNFYVLNNIFHNYYSDYYDVNQGLDTILSFFTYFLLLNTLIPISLIITLEIVKIIQGIFIGIDVEGFSKIRKKFIKPNSVSLNEELGMINYIFTDKTGTLTCNKMVMKFCVIGDICYEYLHNDSHENEKLRNKENIISFEDYDMINASSCKNGNGIFDSTQYDNYKVQSKSDENCCIYLDRTEKLIEEYWKALALCHDCTIHDDEYIGMNPDNIELVKSAKFQGFCFDHSRKRNELVITLGDERGKQKRIFQKLCTIEFSSERKRESIIVKEGDKIKLYIKGADNAIEERLNNEFTPQEVIDKNKYYVNLFSARGFRTMYVAMKILTESEYEDFSFKLNEAKMDLNNKNKKLNELYNEIEDGLSLIGCTIVEDRLQDLVPEVIQDLRLAGIKIWMLTGDKMTTAYNIGLSCNLINLDLKMFFIEGKDIKKDENLKDINKEERDQVIIHFIKEYKKFKGKYLSMEKDTRKFGILVDEKALLTITEDSSITHSFLNVAKDAVAVICCRVSPLQKSQVVKMMKEYDPKKITLAIGDGGNDVSMIMEAHIGIGIYGEEGLRAVQASDYAIGEFKILRQLLLFHGYINLMRNSEMIIYFFYKNFVFTIIHFLYGFYNDFSGQTIIDDWFITLYNLLFTSIPLAVRGVLDIDLRASDGELVYLLQSYLYLESRDNPRFSYFTFIFGLIQGIIHAIIFFLICFEILKTSVDMDGNMGDLWFNSVNMFTNILLIVTINLIIFTKYNTYLNFSLIFLTTIFLYAIFIICVHNMSLFNSVGTMNVAIFSIKMWLCILCSCGLCFILDYTINVYRNLLVSSIRNDIKHVDDLDDLENIPLRLKKLLLLKTEKKKKRKISTDEETKEEEEEEEEENEEENEEDEYYDNSLETPNNGNVKSHKIKKIEDNINIIKDNNHKKKVTKESQSIIKKTNEKMDKKNEEIDTKKIKISKNKKINNIYFDEEINSKDSMISHKKKIN